ncbi:MAG: LamG domain-containing protein [Planctomycetaceae bacterium]|nr:LamG domain-containing protein [Planctomycetaceae bacterium]
MSRLGLLGMVLLLSFGDVQADDELAEALTFHAAFDESPDANFAKGDRQIYTLDQVGGEKVVAGITVDEVKVEPTGGRWGGALKFEDVTKQIVMFQGKENVVYDPTGFDMTISFWMSLTPDQDLKPGYVDPFQITDKKWNDASIFIDFTKDNPREVRLGCFSDFKHWNPTETKWDEVAETDRPFVTVKQPPFDRDHWTHVVIVLERMNSTKLPSIARLYLDGRLQGQHLGPHQFTWDPEQLKIMLGIQYVGRLDDFSIFEGALTLEQIRSLAELKNGVSDLYQR